MSLNNRLKTRNTNCLFLGPLELDLLNEKDKVANLLASSRLRERRKITGSLFKLFQTFEIPSVKTRRIYDLYNGDRTDLASLERKENDSAHNDPTINEAYDGMGAVYDLFYHKYGRSSIDDRNMALIGYVHWGENISNAQWDGSSMFFGDGDGTVTRRFTSALDVIGHEMMHGITQYETELAYFCDASKNPPEVPGAINEHISDVFGILTKQYTLNQTAEESDWLLGKEVFINPNYAGRSMKAPGTANPRDRQPSHIRDYVNLPNTEMNDYGGVHINSGIPNHAFYILATQLGQYAWEKAGLIWYKTLFTGLPSFECTFQIFANHTLVTASTLFGKGSSEEEAVYKGWEKVGLSTKPELYKKDNI